MARASGQSGFSLLELLVAITILGMVGSAIAGAVRFGVLTWERGGSAAVAAQNLRSVELALRNQVESLPLRVTRGDKRRALVDFDGQRQQLTLLIRLPAAAAPSERSAVTYALSHDGKFIAALAAELGPPRILMEDVADVAFSYFGQRRRNGPAVWQDSWSGRGRLPSMVQVRLVPTPQAAWQAHQFVIPVVTQTAQGL